MFRQLVILIIALTVPIGMQAKSKNKPADGAQDRIDILSHVPMTGGAVTRATMTQHYSRNYLYVEHTSHALTLIDVTDASHPSIIANFDQPGSVLTAAGDTALISSDAAPAAAPAPRSRTMSIVSFADRAHPQTIKEFANVTCTALDDRRGLIYVANDEGIWILHRNPAQDPELQERYAHEVLYNH